MRSLARVLRKKGDFLAAKELYLRVMADMAQSLGPDHLETLMSMDAFAMLLWSQEEYPAALEMQQKVLAVRQTTQGKSHPDTLASMDSVIESLWGQDKDEAKNLLRDALNLYEERYGEQDLETLKRLTRLA